MGEHAVWVVDSAGPFVDRISPDTNSRVAQYPVGNGPIGVAGDGPLELDLVSDGPHALIAGTTGAGKSELLRSMGDEQ